MRGQSIILYYCEMDSKTTSLTLVAFAVASIVSIKILSSKEDKKKEDKTALKIKSLGIDLPSKSVSPKGNYVSIVPSSGKLLHLCGHIPAKPSGELIVGKLGSTLSEKEGYESARQCAINILQTLNEYLDGNFDNVKRVVKVVGFVNCENDFTKQPQVINGASDLFREVFDERGIHARSAVGTNSLPLNIATEVECIVELY